MHLAHVALWTRNLETQVAFWQRYFDGQPNEKYLSKNRPGFASYFITLANGPTIELMTLPMLPDAPDNREYCGWAHIALNVGDKQAVDALAKKAQDEGLLKSAPRMTGDGYYEAVILDPDGNLIELVAG